MHKIDNHLRIGKPKRDPLGDIPDSGHELFRRLSHECNSFPMPDVVNACVAVLVNVVRQRNKTRGDAEADFNEMFGRMKALLMSHYDGTTGKRRSIFPFHQVIQMQFVDLRDKA